MKKLYFILLVIYFDCNAQMNLQWAFKNTGSMNGFLYGVFKCTNGDLLTIGDNQGGDIDPGVAINTSGNSFFARYSPSGNLVFGRPVFYNTGYNGGGSMSVDDADEFYFSWASHGPYLIDTTQGSVFLNLPLNGTGFAKFNAMGKYQWGFVYPSNCTIRNSVIQSDKSVLIAGTIYNAQVDINPDTGVFMVNSPYSTASFIAKFDSSGNFVNAITFSSASGIYPDFCEIYSMTKDHNDNIYLTGQFIGKVDFAPGSGVDTLTGTTNIWGTGPRFLVKLDNNLNLEFADAFYNLSLYMAIDNNNNLFLYGRASYTADIDPSVAVTLIDTSAFIAKFSPAGSFQWVRTLTGYYYYDIGVNSFETDGTIHCSFFTHDSIVQNTMGLPVNYPVNPNLPFIFEEINLDSSGIATSYFDLNSDQQNMGNRQIIYSDPDHFYFSGRLNGSSDVQLGPGVLTMAPLVNHNEFFLSYYNVIPLSINEHSFQNSLQISPNPVIDHCILSTGKSEIGSVKIIDIAGKVIKELKAGLISSSMQIDFNDMNAGFYLIEAFDKAGKSIGVKKIIRS